MDMVEFSAPGLSPRTRGTAIAESTAGVVRRFIPANAGNGDPIHSRIIKRAVYPRERGERSGGQTGADLQCGLSPRTRGTVRPAAVQGLSPRFIPANAGNGVCRALWRRAGPVYPRERGERDFSC